MSQLETVVRKRQLPDPTAYVEITTTGMKVTCCVYEDCGSYRKLREIFTIQKTKHRWFDTVELFYKVACEHYPLQGWLIPGNNANRNKDGSF